MDWTKAVDIYCERVDASFWSEPVNAVTNLSFLIAAWISWRAAAAERRFDALAIALIALAACIGVGSFLFHTFAQRWAGAADVLPIMLFILVYIYAATNRFLGLGPWLSGLAVIGFLGFSIAFRSAWQTLLPGVSFSEGYLPVLVFIVGYAVILARRGHPAATGMLAAGAIFALSLTFRSLDGPLCAAWPLGTHFMWHVLNGALLGVVTVTYVRHGVRRVAAATAYG